MSLDEHPIPKSRGRPFAPGNAGRPPGARNKATLAAEALLDGQVEAITQKLVDAALAGDMTAIKLVLERVAPPRRSRPISVELPELTEPKDLAEIMRCVVDATLRGELSTSEAESVARLIDGYRRTIETTDLMVRIEALEAARG
ncbi:MAG: hypothetical protein R3C30_09275 [Hyphomonadaceae bacterium]